MVEVDEVGAEEWREREDDGGGVTAGVRDEASGGDGRGVELGAAVDGFGLEGGGERGVEVFELVDGAVGLMVETPCAAQIDDLDVVGEGNGCPLARGLVRGGEEDDVDAFPLEMFPVEGVDGEIVCVGKAGELGVKRGERYGGCVRAVGAAEQDGWRAGEAWVT